MNASTVQLSPKQCEQFGVSHDESVAVCTWILDRIGYVLGADGRGGSGVFVELDNGLTALLTATHVVVPAILSGEISVARHIEGGARSMQSLSLRVAARADAALVTVEDQLGSPRLPYSEWATDTTTQLKVGQSVIAVGAPGEWKSSPDISTRTIESTRALLFWTEITNFDTKSRIVCDIDERTEKLPNSLRGMSGGPLFTLRRELVGINNGEHREASNVGSFLCAIERSQWKDLHTPLLPSNDMPTDYMRQRMGLSMRVRHKSGAETSAFINAELFWSKSTPFHRYGEFGRIVDVRLGTAEAQRRHIINVESIFFLPLEHDEKDRRAALTEEASFVLGSLGCIEIDSSAHLHF